MEATNTRAISLRRIWRAVAVCALLLAGCKSMTPGSLDRVQPVSDKPLAGNVYLLRGFIGIWSYGIDHLSTKIDASGIRASVFQEDQWNRLGKQIIRQYRNTPDHEPLVLIGHSYGADDTLRIARMLQEENIKVDLIITLDPVTPPKVPSNVRLCYNIYQSNVLDSLPFFRGVALEAEDPAAKNLVNVNIRTERTDLLEDDTDHFNIEKNARVHEEVVRKLREFCPPREQWAMRKRMLSIGSVAPARPQPAAPRQVSSQELQRVP